VAGKQTPVPLQLAAGVSLALAQLRLLQGVPIAQSWQPPAPSHLPVRPQVLAASAAHALVRGSALAAKFWHEPVLPGTLHARQGPPHEATSQQTPSTQLPELHSVPLPQVAPRGLLPHEPPLHEVPAAQSEGPLHVVLQSPALHR
jgi:hypothetical protein